MASITGGDKMESALAAISARVRNARQVSVGFLEGSTYPDGTPVPMIAAIQEFGAPNKRIPPRPFFRNMVAEKSGEWPKAVAGLLKSNGYDAAVTLAQVGEAVKVQLERSIASFNSVPLAPSTVAAKGNAKQLVDTGVMLASVAYKVD